MSLTMMTSLRGSTAFNGKKIKREKVPLKRWRSQNRFFQPRSGPFSTDTLECWVIIRQPTSNSAWLRLIQSHSVYETQWYGHNTAQLSFVKATRFDIMFRQKWTKQVQLLNWESLHFSVTCFFLIWWFLNWIFETFFKKYIVGLRDNSCCVSWKYHLNSLCIFTFSTETLLLASRRENYPTISVAAKACDCLENQSSFYFILSQKH